MSEQPAWRLLALKLPKPTGTLQGTTEDSNHITRCYNTLSTGT